MLPCGPTVASSRSPKLGAVATSDAADSEPPACRVATAISSPSGPFSDAVVVCDQTSVTVPPETSTCSPAAEDAPRDAVLATPPWQAVAPRGSVHRYTARSAAVPWLAIQPM